MVRVYEFCVVDLVMKTAAESRNLAVPYSYCFLPSSEGFASVGGSLPFLSNKPTIPRESVEEQGPSFPGVPGVVRPCDPIPSSRRSGIRNKHRNKHYTLIVLQSSSM